MVVAEDMERSVHDQAQELLPDGHMRTASVPRRGKTAHIDVTVQRSVGLRQCESDHVGDRVVPEVMRIELAHPARTQKGDVDARHAPFAHKNMLYRATHPTRAELARAMYVDGGNGIVVGHPD